jgi:hypothetical protein
MKNLKTYILITLALILLAVLAVPAVATGAQNWYLDSNNHPVTGKIMTKTYGAASGSVSVGINQTVYWLADQVAGENVTFPRGYWVIGIYTDSAWGDASFSKGSFMVGEWNPGTSQFHAFNTSNVGKFSWDSGHNLYSTEQQVGSQIIHKGCYLTLQVVNTDVKSHTITTDGRSFIESPSSDPGYPLPELSAVVLLGAGLIGLFGFIQYRRSRTSRTQA